ncbi:MAG TPA: hypothetical protein VHC42_07215 [Rhizomicrobium sp.]|nr:hypothetical protein [Rhizomicrobium sp.]
MIVSYSRNFIFLRTKKTAGTTAETVLAGGCGPEDIVVSRSEAKERDKRGDDDGAKTSADRPDRGGFYIHIPAKEVRALVDPAFWDKALKITVERHPYEKAVSQTFYRLNKRKRNRHEESFEQFLDRVVRSGDYAGFPIWSIDGKPVVDEFIRQETLRADLDRVGGRLGIAIPDELPMMKSRTRTDRRPASEILSAEQKQIVYEHCKEEFEILGYAR